MLLEFTAAAVFRIEEGLVGTRVAFLGMRRDDADATRDLGAAGARVGAALGLGPARAEAASRDLMVGIDLEDRVFIEGPFAREVGACGCGCGVGGWVASSSLESLK